MKSVLFRYSIQCSIALIAYYLFTTYVGLQVGLLNFIVDVGILYLFQHLYFKKLNEGVKPLFKMSLVVALIYFGFKLFEINLFDQGTLDRMYADLRAEYLLFGRTEAEMNQGMDFIKSILNKTTWPIYTAIGVFVNAIISLLAVFVVSKFKRA